MNGYNDPYRVTIARHGVAVMLVGLIGGFAWAFALLGEVSLSPVPFALADGFPGEPARWRAVHIGCLLNGLMALGISAIWRLFAPGPRQAKWIRGGVLAAIWGNTVFYLLGVVAPNHGLSIGDNAIGAGNLAGAIAYIAAMIAAVALVVVLVILLRVPTRAGGGEQS